MLSERQKPNILVIIKLTSLILDVHKSHYFDFSGKIMIFPLTLNVHSIMYLSLIWLQQQRDV